MADAAVVELTNDRDLVTRAASGDPAAFDALYRRHGGTSWRLAQALNRDVKIASAAVAEAFGRVFDTTRRGAHSADEPFRARLIAATRNASVDAARAARAQGESRADAPHEPEPDLLTRAFTGLPERWRAVLWLTEVEGLRAHDAGPLVGLSPSGAAQVLTRARGGLRQRYLQAHTLGVTDRECARAASHLAGYIADTLTPRDASNVEDHLALCAACRDRVTEIDDAAARLGGIALPIPAALGDDAKARWAAAVGVQKPSSLALVVPGGEALPRWAQRGLVGAAAASVAAGVLAAAILSGRDATCPARQLAVPAGRVDAGLDGGGFDGLTDPNLPAGSAIDVPSGDASTGTDAGSGSAGGAGGSGTGSGAAADALGGTDRPRSSTPTPTPPPSGGSGGDDNGNNETPPPPPPPSSSSIGASTNVGGVPVGVGADPNAGTGGAQAGPVVVGNPPPAADQDEDEPVDIDLGDVADQLPIGLP